MAGFPLDSVSKDELFTVTHDFPVSSDELLAAFTSGELFRQWYAPAGWSIRTENFIFEPTLGGRIQLVMKHESSPTVVSPVYLRFESMTDTLLEFTEALADPAGQPSSQLLGWRVRFLPATVITENGVGLGTSLILEQGPLPKEVHEQAASAWSQAFSQLEKLLMPAVDGSA